MIIKSRSVNFTDKERDLMEYSDSLDNFSKYVKRLIRKDMDQHNTEKKILENLIFPGKAED